jgi:diaminohydroxyphosphoribosylaminopyrimidine deaminase/5-amino-6-(5-phosphoribosylamino)uracil reductase
VIGSRETPADAALRGHPHEPLFFDGPELRPVLEALRERGIQRVFVEGGPALASAFVREDLADEVLAYIAPVLLGGNRLALGDIGVATIADARRLQVASVERLGDDLLVVARPSSSTEEGEA